MNKYKYAGILPDLDTAPDVYETPDKPEDPSYVHESNSEDESHSPQTRPKTNIEGGDMDSSRIDIKSARSRFSAAKFDSSKEGSRRHPRRTLPQGYLPEGVSYTIAPKNSGGADEDDEFMGTETPLERLRRLRVEIEEVEEEIAKNKEQEADESSTTDAGKTGESKERNATAALLAQIRYMKNDLSRLSNSAAQSTQNQSAPSSTDNSRLHALIEGLSLDAKSPKQQTPETTANKNIDAESNELNRRSELGQIDLRLAKLEKFIGANEADVDEVHPLPAPMLTTLAKIEHQLHLLTQPRHLDSISRRVKLLVADLEKVHESRRKLGDTRPLNVSLSSGITVVAPGKGGSTTTEDSSRLPADTAQQVEALFSTLPRIESLAPAVPQLVMRLRSLASLHGAAGSFVDDLETVRREGARLSESAERTKEAVTRLEASMAANASTVQANMAALEARLAKLQ